MAITKSGTRSMKGQTRFRGNPKSALQIKPAWNTVAVSGLDVLGVGGESIHVKIHILLFQRTSILLLMDNNLTH